VPNLDFFAVGDDRRTVLDIVFGLSFFRVFELYAEPGEAVREFQCVDEVPVMEHGPHMMLHAIDAGVEPILNRVDPNRPSALLQCDGWGLVKLHLYPELGSPQQMATPEPMPGLRKSLTADVENVVTVPSQG
jgi:hypothetical protein